MHTALKCAAWPFAGSLECRSAAAMRGRYGVVALACLAVFARTAAQPSAGARRHSGPAPMLLSSAKGTVTQIPFSAVRKNPGGLACKITFAGDRRYTIICTNFPARPQVLLVQRPSALT